MMKNTGKKAQQIKKAEQFLTLHHDPKLLVLPNIWDPIGARLLQGQGYPAVATASAAVAFSLGYDDGQKITLAAMIEAVRRVADSVDVPVTADMEGGYAEQPKDVAENMRQVLQAGAVGINFEDSRIGGDSLHDIDFQGDRIRAIRSMANQEGVPLVINARVDTYIREDDLSDEDRLAETITRAKAYLEAGADCIYPIVVHDLEILTTIQDAIQAPINVLALPNAPSMRELEAAGIARLSLGPFLFKAALTTMQNVAKELLAYGSYDVFSEGAMSSDEVHQYLRDGRMGA